MHPTNECEIVAYSLYPTEDCVGIPFSSSDSYETSELLDDAIRANSVETSWFDEAGERF